MKILLLLLSTVTSLAQTGDLILPDARYLAKFDRLVCRDFDEAGIQTPESLASDGVVFEKLVADGMVIQFLVTAVFRRGEVVCHYSALLMRARKNNLARTDSRVYSDHAEADCSAGKEKLDALFTRMPFAYTSHPIRFISLKIPTVDAVQVCGEGANSIRLVFDLVRK